MRDPVETINSAPLQFERAEFATPRRLTCAGCQRDIADEYSVANGAIVCPGCRERLGANDWPLRSNDALRAFGFGAAMAVGAAAGVVAVSQMVSVVGLGSVVLGMGVGRAVRLGSRGAGGGFYQGLAMVLTYLGIGLIWALMAGGQDVLNAPATWLEFMLRAPFETGRENVLYIFFNGVALFQAWQANRRTPLQFTGPFRITSPNPSSPDPEVPAGG